MPGTEQDHLKVQLAFMTKGLQMLATQLRAVRGASHCMTVSLSAEEARHLQMIRTQSTESLELLAELVGILRAPFDPEKSRQEWPPLSSKRWAVEINPSPDPRSQ
jgi:hypothetical protein